ncbi:MAG: isoprenylcysteine carboxylmethyltransferase family protein, partial [Anaerolineales bacterium]|nr:isoprenylcysteine carboxylmethyltransferase family protein [Anaerolineales bacterium]
MTEQNKPVIWRAIVQMVAIVVIAPFLPMIISARWDWPQAWAYAVSSVLAFVISRLIVARKHPDLIKERARFMQAKDTKSWDKILAPLLGLGSILILIVAGLDKLYAWSPASNLTVNLIALTGIVLGYGFSSWALIENRFFAGTVRIQTERGHHVVSTGPYRIMRHPGYAGGLFGYVFIPLLLDSLWAWIPTILLVIVLVIRTSLEDKTLQAELPGYKEYAQKTRHRLLPG